MSINSVILAAGLSSRCEKYKLSLIIDKKTIIEKCLEGLYDISDKIIIVTGHNKKLINKILINYEKCEFIYNKDFEKGMFSSIKKGVFEVESERFFLIPADYPLVKKSTYKILLKNEGDFIVPSFKRKCGHPVLLSKKIKEKILQKEDDYSLKKIRNEVGFKIVEVEDEGILKDIDVYEDYIKMKEDRREVFFDAWN